MRIIVSNLFLLLMATVVGGCVPAIQEEPSLKSAVPVLAGTDQSAVQKTRQRIEGLVNREAFAQAHRELLDARRQGLTETTLSEVYVKVESRLLQEARRAEIKNHFAQAGRFYRMALTAYPKQPGIQSGLQMSAAEIAAQIERCADELMKNGLVAYRGGELVAAVAIWKKVIEFHPEHSPSLVAIATAEQQLESLSKIAPAKVM